MSQAQPARVAFVVTGLERGGAEMMLLKLVRTLDKERFSPSVISLSSGGDLVESFERIGVAPTLMGAMGLVDAPRHLGRLIEVLRHIAPDIVHGWMYHGNLAASLACRRLGTAPRLMWGIRMSGDDLSSERLSTRMLIRLGALWASKPARIVTNSRRSALTHALRLGYRGNWSVIPNGFDTEEFSPAKSGRAPGPESLRIGMVARYHGMKDHATFLEAASLFAKTDPGTRFILVGDGITAENAALGATIARLRLVDRVLLLGRRADIPAVMASLDIATLSSARGEGFPNVLGEAMSCGIPCVTTDVGDAALVVGNTGLVVPPRDPDALCAAWKNLADLREEQRRELGRQARQRVIDHFSIQSITRRYQQVFEEVLHPSQPAPCAA